MLCTYLPRVTVHADRHGTSRPLPPRWIVVHTSEQAYERASAAADLAEFMTRPGDRLTSTGSRYGSSYHDVVDAGLVVRPAVEHHLVSFSAPGSNTEGLHVCLPALAGQSAAEWDDDYSSAQIDTLAAYLVDQCRRYAIPLTFPLTVDDLRAGRGGVTDHYRIGRAFGRTDHTDVGAAFPWDLLADAVNRHTTPTPPDTEEEPMQGIVAIYQPTQQLVATGKNKSFALLPDGNVRHATGPDTALDRPSYPILGPEHYAQCEALDAVWRSK